MGESGQAIATRSQTFLSRLAGAAAGGAAWGACDAVASAVADTLSPSLPRVLLLVVAQGVTLGLLAALLAAPLLALAGRLRWPGLGPLLGLALVLAVDGAERFFRAPAPFSEPEPRYGQPLVFAGLLLAGAVLLLLLARASALPRVGRLIFPAALLGALVVRWEGPRALPPLGAASSSPPLILVTLDTTRDDHVAREGGPARTPVLDNLAKVGARFDLALSQIPITGPSHTTILSGTGPWEHGVLLNGHPVPPELPLLTDTLRASGYHTGAFVSAFVLTGGFGFHRGFEVYDDDFGRLPGWSDTLGGRLADGLGRRLHPELAVERQAGATVDRALAWLASEGLDQGGPFFLWVHLFDPHGPYLPPGPWDTAYYEGDPRDPKHDTMSQAQGVAPYLLPSLRGVTDLRWVLAQYAGEVSYADQELGRLLAWVDAHHPGALVAVAGDHGESLGEHGVWFNHGDDLFDASMRVPLLIRLPDRVPAGLRVGAPVELVDLAPTLLDLLGLAPLPSAEGIALTPWLSGDPPAEPPHPFARSLTYDRPANQAARAAGQIDAPRWRVAALRTEHGRYVLREAPGTGEAWYVPGTGAEERASGPPPEDLGPALRAVAEALLQGQAHPSPEGLDPATEERLRALGYVDE